MSAYFVSFQVLFSVFFFFFFGPGFMSGLLKADRQLSICPVFGRVSVTGGSVETFLWVCWVFTVDSDS